MSASGHPTDGCSRSFSGATIGMGGRWTAQRCDGPVRGAHEFNAAVSMSQIVFLLVLRKLSVYPRREPPRRSCQRWPCKRAGNYPGDDHRRSHDHRAGWVGFAGRRKRAPLSRSPICPGEPRFGRFFLWRNQERSAITGRLRRSSRHTRHLGFPRNPLFFMVEPRRIELPTFALRTRRSPS